jgi:hypothetical protein
LALAPVNSHNRASDFAASSQLAAAAITMTEKRAAGVHDHGSDTTLAFQDLVLCPIGGASSTPTPARSGIAANLDRSADKEIVVFASR